MSDIMVSRFALSHADAARAGRGRAISSPRIALRTYLTRQALAELSSRELADIGVSASAAVAEAARLPWDTTPGPRRNRPGILGVIHRILERARTRRLLAGMEARELRDIGVSRSDAQIEASKSFWRS